MNLRNVPLLSLHVFLSAVRRGSLSAAAREHGLDRSSVSRQISALERTLGFRLFERTTRRLAPTEAGQVFFDRAAGLLAQLEEARLAAADVVGAPAGILRVSTSVAFGERWLLPRLPAFQQRYPDLTLELMLDDAVVDLVRESIDLGIRLSPSVDEAAVVTKLMATRYRVVASPDYLDASGPLSDPKDLSERRCVCFTLPGFRSYWRFRRGSRDTVEVPVRASLMISNALAVRRAALDGLGPALLADWTIEQDLADGSLVDLLPDWQAAAKSFDTAAWILYPSRSYVPAKTRALIDHIKTCAARGSQTTSAGRSRNR